MQAKNQNLLKIYLVNKNKNKPGWNTDYKSMAMEQLTPTKRLWKNQPNQKGISKFTFQLQ